MPARLGKVPGAQAIAFLHTCDVCGEEAHFGTGLSFRKALNAAEQGKYDLCKELLGKQYCLTHWRELK